MLPTAKPLFALTAPVDGPAPCCLYQVKGRLLTGEEAVICTLEPGACPLQRERPTTAGRHTVVCLQPQGIFSDWQQEAEGCARPELVLGRATLSGKGDSNEQP